jgi:ring-1,2-phenylacetyl-CoA epoxidase subunit PaaB
MRDTQWNRYQVFVQESEGKPHLDYGSVHAPDAELALLNARDVFARRPECISMWVVPVDAIFSITAENLQAKTASSIIDQELPEEPYLFFIKARQNGTMSFAGAISAQSPDDGLRKALQSSSDWKSALVWWIIPEHMVVKSDLSQQESDFAPARDKAFRLSTDFHTVSDMRKIKETTGGNPE